MSSSMGSRFVAFVNSDTLIKGFVENDPDTVIKLRNEEAKLKVHVGEKFLINDFVFNDVIAKALEKQMNIPEIQNKLYPGYTLYYMILTTPEEMVNDARIALLTNPDFKLTLTDWTALNMMIRENVNTIISYKTELDKVINDSRFTNQFRNIRRI